MTSRTGAFRGPNPDMPGMAHKGISMASSRVMVGLAASAAALAGIALQVRANAHRAEREHPPAGRFIHAGGIRLHYLEAGIGGPPVVLLHGNAVQAEDYVAAMGTANALATGYGRRRLRLPFWQTPSHASGSGARSWSVIPGAP
jgi:hypothetical protein